MQTLMNQTEAKTTGVIEASDEELMQGIIDRRQQALDQLYARYRPLISKIVMEILPNEADAEEALQDVFMEIWTRAANFDVRKGKPLGWIICMARRRAIDHYRKIRRRAEAPGNHQDAVGPRVAQARAEVDAVPRGDVPRALRRADNRPALLPYL